MRMSGASRRVSDTNCAGFWYRWLADRYVLQDVTGPKDASKGVLIIYDIFGYFPQTLQGADILSSSDDHQKYKVVMPDWFKGEPCPIEW